MTEFKKEVLLIRHGESETNATNMFQAGDQFESDPLNATGQQQAQWLAEEFTSQAYEPEIVIASGYKRSLQTAQIIGRIVGVNVVVPVYNKRQIITDKPPGTTQSRQERFLFRELDLPSELAGLPYDDPVAKDSKYLIKARAYTPDWHFSDEENLYDIWQRAALAKNYITDRPEQKIAVFSHGGFIKAILAHIMFDDQPGWSLEQKLQAYQAFTAPTWIDNTGVVPLFQNSSNGQWQWLMSYNKHLKSSFGFMNNSSKPSAETSADELRRSD